ncbi:MAG: hypothetical protein CVU52_08020 [Deltaproteobacteria bacterium HGW-Deltaproteobacteria-10]|nr:MAG: hypothetical protein CVU52_08020 [Deltaproteobacteria bacterium HGW-Deltaproteobacteria-10]
MTIFSRISISLIFSVIFWHASVGLAATLYTEETRSFLTALRNDNVESALEYADSFTRQTIASGKAKQNKYLALLERGKVALNAGRYDQCIADLQEAEKRFLTIEGTISLTEGFGSILTDDTAKEYEAEMHEKIMISPYLALAYLGKGDLAGALVERNRTMNKIHQYVEEKEERSYLENPFARLLSAIMYEMENKLDDAKIEYRKMKWETESATLSTKGKTTDLVILIDTGLAPHKYQVKWGPLPVVSNDTTIHLGFAYASYAATPSAVSKCEIALGGKALGAANLLYDLENTVLTQYEKDKAAIIAKLVTRMTAKAATQVSAHAAADRIAKDNPLAGFLLKSLVNIGSAVWMAVEQADLRGWSTLPGKIYYLRVNGLPPGEHAIKIDYGCGVQEKTIKLEKDKIGIAYFSYAK